MNTKVIGSGLLIAGTCIGAVTIVLPLSLLSLGSIGVPLMLAITACFVYYSGALIFEITSFFPKGTDLATMAGSIIGPWAGRFVQILFCFLLYCLLAAYMTGGAVLISEKGLMHTIGIIIWALFGLLVLFFGIRVQDLINRFFMMVLVISYSVFLLSSGSHVKLAQMTSVPFVSAVKSVAILVTAFGFHVIIPSLRDYIGDDPVAHKQALCLGLVLPLLIYFIWCFVLYGLLPYEGDFGLLKLSMSDVSYFHISSYLYRLQPSNWIPISVSCFMLTSILSSYVGISLSLLQSLSGYFRRFNIKLIFLINLVLLPPVIFALIKPNGFLLALRYAAVIIAIISFLLPVAMVCIKRKAIKMSYPRIFGLIVTTIYSIFIIYSSFY